MILQAATAESSQWLHSSSSDVQLQQQLQQRLGENLRLKLKTMTGWKLRALMSFTILYTSSEALGPP